jgi:hypothetical protein
MATPKKVNADQAVLMAGFARIDPMALAVAVGVVCAIAFFLMTVTLLLKGAPEGKPIGPHLGLLSAYLPGYSVSWGGSFIGAGWLGILGGVVGFIWGVLWNLTHYLYIVLVVVRAHWWRMMAD